MYNVLIVGLLWFNFDSGHRFISWSIKYLPSCALLQYGHFMLPQTAQFYSRWVTSERSLKWSQISQNYVSLCKEEQTAVCKDIKLAWLKYRSFAVVGVIIAIICMCLNMAALGYLSFVPVDDGTFALDRTECSPWNSTVACGLLTVLNVYATAAWILPGGFLCLHLPHPGRATGWAWEGLQTNIWQTSRLQWRIFGLVSAPFSNPLPVGGTGRRDVLAIYRGIVLPQRTHYHIYSVSGLV